MINFENGAMICQESGLKFESQPAAHEVRHGEPTEVTPVLWTAGGHNG